MEYTFAGLPLPLRIKPPHPLTDDEIMRFCADHEGVGVERDENGYLVIMTPAGGITSNKNVYICRVLDIWAEEDGRGLAFDSNAGFTLPDTSMRSPDAAWVSLQQWNALPYMERERFVRITPEFLIELRSPSDSVPHCRQKMEMWIRNGVMLAWLIDPYERSVTVYRQHCRPERLDNISQISGEGPVAGFVLPLDRIFA